MIRVKINTKIAGLVLLGTLPALSGCATAQEIWDWDPLNWDKSDDVTMNGRAAPLVVPPDYALEPAPTGLPQQNSTQEQTLDALFGGTAQRSAAERTLSSANADSGIRSGVGDPKTLTVNKGLITRDIIAAPEGDGQYAQAAVPQ